jgi:diguanylate cyclase (GGDEF)-like protein
MTAEPPAQANRRILVIDDMPGIHQDFHMILGGAGPDPVMAAAEMALFGDLLETYDRPRFDIDSAFQGREGLEMVRSSLLDDRPYAMAFVDMRMPPGWDGVETVREIWKVDPRLQVVICTAHSDYSWDVILSEFGAEDRLLFLKKPFETAEVAQLASALTTKWDTTRHVGERTRALEVANQELEALVREFTHLATHDTLTGLPNRLLFADRAAQVLAVARRTGSSPSVLMLDLDRFKEVNDTLDHLHGDLLLTQVAGRLSEVLRPGDTVARFGGDEFVLLLPDGGAEAAAEVAGRIALALEAPFVLGDSTVSIEASMGIAVAAPAEGLALPDLFRQAESAMFKAKADRCGYAYFVARSECGTPNRLTVIGELRQALDCDELVVHYQPKVAIDTGDLVGVEALVRWQHPTRGLLPPGEFIAQAEGSTLIQRLTAVVLTSALRCARGWLDEGLRLPVAVNVSARSLCDPQFPAMVSDRLAQAGVPAGLLTIELTEGTVLAYPGLALGILHRLRDIGVHLSVDDYGTGYSSMAYLKNLPVTELKIDRSFVRDLANDSHDAFIVQSATDLGHDLGLCVVAEGVEDEATLTILRNIGVDVVQGYHLGRPMPQDLLERWVEDRPGASTSSAENLAGPALPGP